MKMDRLFLAIDRLQNRASITMPKKMTLLGCLVMCRQIQSQNGWGKFKINFRRNPIWKNYIPAQFGKVMCSRVVPSTHIKVFTNGKTTQLRCKPFTRCWFFADEWCQ